MAMDEVKLRGYCFFTFNNGYSHNISGYNSSKNTLFTTIWPKKQGIKKI